MKREISTQSKAEVADAIRQRYRKASKTEKVSMSR